MCPFLSAVGDGERAGKEGGAGGGGGGGNNNGVDAVGGPRGKNWRRNIKKAVNRKAYSIVTYETIVLFFIFSLGIMWYKVKVGK